MSQPVPSMRNLELVEGWGQSTHAFCNVYRPTDAAGIREVFKLAAKAGLSVALRGTGCSYGDASLNDDNLLLDLTHMKRILNWDAKTGVIQAESGLTVKDLWQSTVEDGYWPPVVSGTMFPTLGGVLAMNIHGKNNFKVGPIGNHVLEFELMLPDGTVKKCSRKENSELFHAAIGGFGMLGVFLHITLQMKKVYSGYVSVEPIITENLQEMFDVFEERIPESDYLVGWIDCMAKGRGFGRGIIHQANYLKPGEDPDPKESLRASNQGLPDKLFGVFPSSLMYVFLKPFVNNLGMRFINAGKFWSAAVSLRGQRYLQSHAAFSFLLDYVPNWKWAYKPGGLIQYQSFVPKEAAPRVFAQLIRMSQESDMPPYLGVFKRHQPDDFLMTHALDGYSFALDYRVTQKNRAALWDLAHAMDQVVLDAGGRFYFAKDSTLEKSSVLRFFGEEKLREFARLKTLYDPENILQTNLTRRVFDFAPAAAHRQSKTG